MQPATTSTALVSSANPGPIGAPITYTATVSVVAPGTGTPTGTVSFTDQGSPVAGCQSLSLPATAPLQVTCTETYGSNSAHSIVATYSGDTNDATSHQGLVETLQQIGTQTTVGSSSPTSTYGQSVTFTATVTPIQSASVNPSGHGDLHRQRLHASIGTVVRLDDGRRDDRHPDALEPRRRLPFGLGHLQRRPDLQHQLVDHVGRPQRGRGHDDDRRRQLGQPRP